MTSSLPEVLRSALTSTVYALNSPVVKERIKDVVGSVTFVFGVVEIYDICQVLSGRNISTEEATYANSPRWMRVANKVALVCTKISLILSAATVRPGYYLISGLSGLMFSSEKLESFFGKHEIFKVNPWHPRHVLSISAALLAVPVALQVLYRFFGTDHSKSVVEVEEVKSKVWLTDARVRMMSIFNTVTSRPILHFGNRLCRWVVRW